MNFQKRMIFIFSFLIIASSIVFGTVYFMTVQKNYVEVERKNLQTAADNYGQQFRHTIGQMEEIIQQLFSNQDFLQSVRILAQAGTGGMEQSPLYTSARNTVRACLNTDYFKRNLNRVVHFMQNGSVISGTNYSYNPVEPGRDIRGLDWLERLEGKRGKYVILGIHQDDWRHEKDCQVISVVKQILGEELGYLEIQKRVEDLDELFIPQNTDWDLYIFQEKELLYASDRLNEAKQKQLENMIAQRWETIETGGQIYAENGKIIAISRLYEENFRAVIVDATPISREAVKAALPFAFMLIFLTGIASFAYIYLMSRYMSKPIRQMKQQMENTDIHNFQILEPVEIKDKEIRKLYESYENVLQKLQKSIQKERILSELQRKAQFDLLQAQVNPHFLFNVLNVISGRGAEADDEVICDICADLGEMLRYSTNVQEKQAKLKEEIHYLQLYLELLKFRYADMLEYEIHIDSGMDELEVPKMVVQQIVENSIMHGFKNTDRMKRIAVTGECSSTEWNLKIRDNGTGIEEEIRKEIYRKWSDIKDALSEKRSHVEMAIGGMGLVNTYARLYQIYGESLLMELHSLPEGTEVSINVQSTNSR